MEGDYGLAHCVSSDVATILRCMKPSDDELADLYLVQKLSYKQIARRQGVTAQSVMRWLRAAGIPARSISEATSLATKGVPKSPEHQERLRESIKHASAARKPEHFAAQAAKMKGRTPPNKGKLWTPEERAKHMAYRKTDEYRAKLAESQRGEKSHLWRGGQTDAETRRMQGWEWRKRRLEVYERDDWTCQDCGRRGGKLHAHHIKPWAERPDLRYDSENGVTLCPPCHYAKHRGTPRPRGVGPRTLAALRSGQP